MRPTKVSAGHYSYRGFSIIKLGSKNWTLWRQAKNWRPGIDPIPGAHFPTYWQARAGVNDLIRAGGGQ